jgi:hypothetical protein
LQERRGWREHLPLVPVLGRARVPVSMQGSRSQERSAAAYKREARRRPGPVPGLEPELRAGEQRQPENKRGLLLAAHSRVRV